MRADKILINMLNHDEVIDSCHSIMEVCRLLNISSDEWITDYIVNTIHWEYEMEA